MDNWQSRSPHYAPQPWPENGPRRACYQCGESLLAGQQYVITARYADVLHWDCYRRRLGR